MSRKLEVRDIRPTLKQIAEFEGDPFGGDFKFSFSSVTFPETIANLNSRNFGGSYGISGTRTTIVERITFLSSIDFLVWIGVDMDGSGMFTGMQDTAGHNYFNRVNMKIQLKAGISYDLYPKIFYQGWAGGFKILAGESVPTPFVLNLEVSGRAITNDVNVLADKSVLFIGDSITMGGFPYEATTKGNPTTNEEAYTMQIARHLRQKKGYNIRAINKGISGITSGGVLNAIKWGYYNVLTPPALICLTIGTNDCFNVSPNPSSSEGMALFRSNMVELVTRLNNMYPNSKILVNSPTPVNAPIHTAILDPMRAVISSVVSDMNKPTQIYYHDLGNSFDGSNPANFSSGDTVHPIVQNVIAQNICDFIDGTINLDV